MTMKRLSSLILALLPLCLAAEPALKPLAFYMKNLPCPRIGTQTDGQIRASLEADGFIVIDLDFSGSGCFGCFLCSGRLHRYPEHPRLEHRLSRG